MPGDLTRNIEPKLLMFFSVDVVGSTAYKNLGVTRKGVQHWLYFFEQFYSEFSMQIKNSLKSRINDTNRIERILPRLWKSAGDELLYKARIQEIDDVKLLTFTFRDAVKRYMKGIKKRDLPLKLKATSWLAGFPVINADIKSPDENNPAEDYIGPSMDIGFRLCQSATVNRFVISIEIAYILANKCTTEEYSKDTGGLYYEGEKPLKGVLNGKPYPIFWLLMNKKVEKSRLDLMKISKADATNVKEYCTAYIKDVNNPYILVEPYLVTGGKNSYNSMPKQHEKVLKRMQREPMNMQPSLEPKDVEEAKGKPDASILDDEVHKL